MKQLVIPLTLLVAGFISGYLLNHDTDASTKAEVHRDQIPSQSAATNGSAQMSLPTYEDISTQTSVFEKFHVGYQVAALATPQELEAYILRSVTSEDALYSGYIASIFSRAYSAIDPIAALNFVQSNDEIPTARFVTQMMNNWALVDEDAVVEYLATIKDPMIAQRVARILSGYSPELAAKVAAVIKPVYYGAGPGPGSVSAVGAGVGPMSPPDFGQLLQDAMHSNDQHRALRIDGIMKGWINQDPKKAIESIKDLNHRNKNLWVDLAIDSLARTDAEAALAYYQQNSADDPRSDSRILSKIAVYNPMLALPEIEKFIARTGNAKPLYQFVSSLAEQDITPL